MFKQLTNTKHVTLCAVVLIFAYSIAHPITTFAAKPIQPTSAQKQKLKKAVKLQSDYKNRKMSREDAMQYKRLVDAAKRKEAMAKSRSNAQIKKQLKPKPQTPISPSVGSFATQGGVAKSCKCTVTCQAILILKGSSYNWTVSTETPSPSACADTAVATCSNAYASYLVGWNCK